MASLSRQEKMLRQGFKYGNKWMMFMWRLGLGKCFTVWPSVTGQVMVIVHTGRKTGLKRYTPVNYAIVDGDIYCTSAFGTAAYWYQNILATTAIEVWLPDSRWCAVAEDVSGDGRRLELLRQVLIGSGFAAPLFAGVFPKSMTDDELDTLSRNYSLIRIKRTKLKTESNESGDMVWLWLLATVVLLLMLLWRRRRK